MYGTWYKFVEFFLLTKRHLNICFRCFFLNFANSSPALHVCWTWNLHCKKRLEIPGFLTKPSWSGLGKLFPARENFLVTSRLGTGIQLNLFYSVRNTTRCTVGRIDTNNLVAPIPGKLKNVFLKNILTFFPLFHLDLQNELKRSKNVFPSKNSIWVSKHAKF